MKRLTAFLLRHVIVISIVVIVGGSVTTFVVQANLNTGRVVSFPHSETLVFNMPSGVIQPIILPANTGVSIVGKEEERRVRLWVKKAGYALSPLPFANRNDQTSAAH